MPKLKDLADVAANPELLTLFEIAVKRSAYQIVADTGATAPQQAWAKRVLGDPGLPGRANWYASRILEGALVESQSFRDAVDASLSAGTPVSLTDAQFIGLVTPWVARFAAQNI
jgi:hypothetical protein